MSEKEKNSYVRDITFRERFFDIPYSPSIHDLLSTEEWDTQRQVYLDEYAWNLNFILYETENSIPMQSLFVLEKCKRISFNHLILVGN